MAFNLFTSGVGETSIQGPKGDAGEAAYVAGTAATVGALPASAPANALYYVEATGDYYAWDGDSWENRGHVQGPTNPLIYHQLYV